MPTISKDLITSVGFLLTLGLALTWCFPETYLCPLFLLGYNSALCFWGTVREVVGHGEQQVWGGAVNCADLPLFRCQSCLPQSWAAPRSVNKCKEELEYIGRHQILQSDLGPRCHFRGDQIIIFLCHCLCFVLNVCICALYAPHCTGKDFSVGSIEHLILL